MKKYLEKNKKVIISIFQAFEIKQVPYRGNALVNSLDRSVVVVNIKTKQVIHVPCLYSPSISTDLITSTPLKFTSVTNVTS